MNDAPPDWTKGEARIVLSSCQSCHLVAYLPRRHCPECGGNAFSYSEAAGPGLCVAVTRLHVTADDAATEPIGLALVELDEGPLVLGRAGAGPGASLAPGDRVRVGFEPLGPEHTLLPTFSRDE